MTTIKKNFKIWISSALFATSILGCHEGFLEEKVYDTLTPINFYKSEADIQAGLTAVYNAMHSNDCWGRQVWLAAEYPGESSWPNSSGEAWRTELDQYTWTPSSTGFKTIWSGLYRIVNRANTVLQYADQVTTYSSQARKDQILAETRFLRGLAYLTLVRFFDHVPYVTEQNTDDLYPSNEGTDDQVWNLIIEDFKYALSVLPPKHTGANIGRATAGAAQTMLTKAYLTRAGKPWNKAENWALAAEEANKIMNNTAYGYGLHANYENVFTIANEHAQEYVFSLELESGIGLGKDLPTFTGIRSGNQLRLDGWSSLVAEKKFFDSMAATDKRRSTTFVLSYPDIRGNGTVYTYPQTITLPHYNKLINADDNRATGTGDYATNLPITRYSDVLLMQSEAENEAKGPSTEAVKGINMVRQRAGLAPLTASAMTKESLRDAIIQERAWELCEEGHAYFDLKRQNAIGKRITTFSTTEKSYAFPVPQDEVDVNPNLKQHPLYR
jgi:hypothetical protein